MQGLCMEREIMRYLGEKGRRGRSTIKAAAFGLLCIMVLALLPAKDVLAVEGTVTASSANIRASADPNSQILASVLNGDKLSIKEEVTGTDGNVWFYVFIDSDRLGYVRSDLVKKDDGSAPSPTTTITPTPTPAPATNPSAGNNGKINLNATVNRDGVEEVQPVSASVNSTTPVRVRADSSTDAEIVTTVKKDVVLTVHGRKTAGNGDLWYLVSFMVDNTEVNGYVHSNYVALGGELLPVEPEVPEQPDVPEEPTPEEPVVPEKDWYTLQRDDGTWLLVENATGNGTPIADMFTSWNKAVDDLEAAQGKISRQTVIIVILSILLVVLALGVTLLIFKIKDVTEDDGFDMGQRTPVRRSGDRPARPAGSQARPAGSRPAGSRPATRPGTAGSRPAGAARPEGARPASSAQGGTAGSRPAGAARPDGTRPASSAQAGRPAGAARPDGTRPASSAQGGAAGSRPAAARPGGARPAQPAGAARPAPRPQESRPVSSAESSRLERQARADVETRNLERNTAAQPKKTRNFMSDDDEFEFEFLNWDGDGEA